MRALKANGADVTYFEVDSSYGHDAFLLEEEVQTELISGFLAYTLETAERQLSEQQANGSGSVCR